MYADDIVLIAPTIDALPKLLTMLENQLDGTDMCINATKSSCIRFGRRYEAECKNVTMRNGDKLAWVQSCRYLGVYFISDRLCKCTFENANKRQFYRSFNAILVGLADRPQKSL